MEWNRNLVDTGAILNIPPETKYLITFVVGFVTTNQEKREIVDKHPDQRGGTTFLRLRLLDEEQHQSSSKTP